MKYGKRISAKEAAAMKAMAAYLYGVECQDQIGREPTEAEVNHFVYMAFAVFCDANGIVEVEEE